MFRFLDLSPDIFGIDINDFCVRIAKIRKKGNIMYLASTNEVDLKSGIVKDGVIQDEGALAEVIRSACATPYGEKLKTTYVGVSLPEEKSFTQMIQMPKMAEKELSSAVFFEAENYIPLPIETMYLDYQVINDHDEDKESHIDVLINVMPRSIVDSYVSCLRLAGLTPCFLEVESQAIARSVIQHLEKDAPILIIDMGVVNTSFIIFSGNSIRFTSSIPVFSQQFTDTIAQYCKIDAKEAESLKKKYGIIQEGNTKYDIKKTLQPLLVELVQYIKKYLNFYRSHSTHEYFLTSSQEKNIEKIILCGGGAHLKGLSEFLAHEIGIPVETADPFINIGHHNTISNQIVLDKKNLSFTTVIGLALRGMMQTIYD